MSRFGTGPSASASRVLVYPSNSLTCHYRNSQPLYCVDTSPRSHASELLELAVRSGMKVLEAMMEEDRIGLCGVRYAHEPDDSSCR